jgi:DNA-directed RNA polymerase beta subunit
MTQLAPGARALIRDEEWLIRRVDPSADGGWLLTCDGISDLVRGQSALFLTALEDDIEIQKTTYREVPLFFMPVMLRSAYCHLSNLRNLQGLQECEYDQGGYFIIRGNPKVIQPQKVQRINIHIVRTGKGDLPIDAEIRSLRADEKFRSTSTLYIHYGGSPAIFKVDIPFLAPGIPMLAVFRALGFHTKDDIEDIYEDINIKGSFTMDIMVPEKK